MKSKPRKKPAQNSQEAMLLAGFWLCLAYSSTMKIKAVIPSDISVNFYVLHGLTFYRIVFFIVTAVITSNST
jgi:hypothetical protein